METNVVVSSSPSSHSEWTHWIHTNTAQNTLVPTDYGLYRIACFLGSAQVNGLQLFLSGAKLEMAGDIKGATQQYKAAYREWPSLDSVHAGGIPVDVRTEAVQHGYLNDPTNVLLDVVDVSKARASRVVCTRKRLLSDDDIDNVLDIQHEIQKTQPDNNPENQRHANKSATMMNNPPDHLLQVKHPSIVGKILKFAQWAWSKEIGNWSGPGGPLEHISKPFQLEGLSVRVVELWEYSVGGGLTDPYHYDTDSIITIVTLLSNPQDFTGGDFCTFEPGDVHKSYPMNKGDSVAFVSHKLHNITELTKGTRRSLVMELWQGGVGHEGR